MNTAGALNWLQVLRAGRGHPEWTRGFNTTDEALVQSSYGEAGDDLVASGCFGTIADVKEVIVARPATATSCTSCRPSSRSASAT